MTASKPMTGEQLDELMTIAVNMQLDSEKVSDRPAAMFAYAVQVAVLELRKVRNEAAALRDEMEAAEKRISELESDNAYIRNRHKELDLLIGKNILVMQAAIIEWQGTGDAKKGLAWIYNTLFGPGELPDEAEKDAQAYFDRKYAPLDEELLNLHRWFWEQSEAERAAVAGKGE
ncbi:ead/Ea22-like family protein [Enterobacter hormaechei]|uniref:ead/Ea22-like family protein n=1 Tax=Enterobacter hormaechei TaxID=158836 RepID=UPI0039FC15C2